MGKRQLRSWQKGFDKYYDSIAQNDEFAAIYALLRAGKNSFAFNRKIVEKSIDVSWVEAIENGLPHLDNVIRNPSRTIEDVEEVVPIALSRKITVESVKHLAQHTDLIQEIDPKTGRITPSKILNIHKEESLMTYENKFINTLVDRLYVFLNIRYQKLVQIAKDEEVYTLGYDGVLDDGAGKQMKISMKVETIDSLDTADARGFTVWDRVEKIKKAIEGYKGSVLCTTLGNARIRPPVMRTNAIMKNVDLKACLALWQYIESYDKVGYELNVSDTAQKPAEDYIEGVYRLAALNFMLMRAYTQTEAESAAELKTQKSKTLSPKFLRKFDKETAEMYDIPYYTELEVQTEGAGGMSENAEAIARELDSIIAIEIQYFKDEEARRIAEEKARAEAERRRVEAENARLERERIEREMQEERERQQREKEAEERRIQEMLERERAEQLAREKAEREERERREQEERERIAEQLRLEEEERQRKLEEELFEAEQQRIREDKIAIRGNLAAAEIAVGGELAENAEVAGAADVLDNLDNADVADSAEIEKIDLSANTEAEKSDDAENPDNAEAAESAENTEITDDNGNENTDDAPPEEFISPEEAARRAREEQQQREQERRERERADKLRADRARIESKSFEEIYREYSKNPLHMLRRGTRAAMVRLFGKIPDGTDNPDWIKQREQAEIDKREKEELRRRERELEELFAKYSPELRYKLKRDRDFRKFKRKRRKLNKNKPRPQYIPVQRTAEEQRAHDQQIAALYKEYYVSAPRRALRSIKENVQANKRAK